MYVWDEDKAIHTDILIQIYDYMHITRNPLYIVGFADIKGGRLIAASLNVWDRRDFKKEDWTWLEDYMDTSSAKIGRWTGD